MKGINFCPSLASFIGLASVTTLVLGNTPPAVAAANMTVADTTTATVSENDSAIATLDAPTPSPIIPAANRVIATIIPHPWQKTQLAVTLRVNYIPVVTFVGTAAELQTFANHQALTKEGNTLQRAEAIASQLNQLAQAADFDANTIKLDFDRTAKQYVIKAGATPLIALDRNTVLPEKRLPSHHSALQITNRLRRLMGGADPLTMASVASPTVTAQPVIAATTLNRIKGGMASWYGPGFHGRRTANGERFNQYALTAAHKSLPFGTRVKVTNLRNGRSVVVRINDRGPFIRGRVIDLSKGAAQVIGVHHSGVANVALEIIR